MMEFQHGFSGSGGALSPAQRRSIWAGEIQMPGGQPAAMEGLPGGGPVGTLGGPYAGSEAINGRAPWAERSGGGEGNAVTGMNGAAMQPTGPLHEAGIHPGGLPAEVIESPTTAGEAYLGSLKAMLAKNLGNYIVASFSGGGQNIVSWEGILCDVGNDYLTIYQEGRGRYVVGDFYALKFMEIYDMKDFQDDGGSRGR